MKLKALERRGKRLLIAVLGFLLGAGSVSPRRIARRRLHRVLVVRQDERLGNVLLITPLLGGLRRALPGAHICVLVSRRFADVLRGNDDIDRILTFDKRRMLRNPFRLVSLIRTLRKGSFNLAVDGGPIDDISLNNSLLTYLSGAPLRLGHRRGDSHLFLTTEVPVVQGKRTEVDHHLDLLRYLFGDVPAGRMKMSLFPEERDRAVQRGRSWGLRSDDVVVGLHVGGRGKKRWAAGQFYSLAERLISRYGVRVLLFWGPNERELVRPFQSQVLRGLSIPPLLPIRDLAAQVERCAVFICNDTGPMHMARAVGTPTVAIFRKPNYDRYGPPDRKNKVVYQRDGEVTVDDVMAAFDGLMKSHRRIEST